MSRQNYGTPFAETEAILAAQLQDTETIAEILSGMLPVEWENLADACELLISLINEMEDGTWSP